MKKYFVVSDVHSFYDELLRALHSKGFDLNNAEHYLILCGDAFDRGTKTVEVFELLKRLHENGRLVYIRGNHEDLFISCVRKLTQGTYGYHDVTNGTIRTIASLMNCSEYDIICGCYDRLQFNKNVFDLVLFIDEVCVDFAQLKDIVFVHGWVPVDSDDSDHVTVSDTWEEGDWGKARWSNGIKAFHEQQIPKNVRALVCGHWNASFGWAKYLNVEDEYSAAAVHKPYVSYNEAFDCKLFAIDACTPVSRTVNCIVFDSEGNLIE